MRLNTFIDTVQGQCRSPELARPLDQEEWLHSNTIRTWDYWEPVALALRTGSMGEAEHILKQCLLGMHTQREGRGKVRDER